MFKTFDFENLSYSNEIVKQTLPTLAFIPNKGIALVYEFKDGIYKAQTKKW